MNVDMKNGIATITINDGKANALSHGLLDALNETLDSLETEAQALIITGREGMFCAGFDLEEIKKGASEAAALASRGAQLFYRLYGYPMPVIGACSGHAIAAGAFALLSCDTRVGADGNFKIGLNETAIGMNHLDWGHELIASRIPRIHVTAAVIQAQLYTPRDAIEVGYLDHVVEVAGLHDSCLELAEELVKLPKHSYGEMKRDVRKESLARIRASFD